MTARRVVILAAAAIVLIFVVTSTYYFVLPHGDSATVTIVAMGGEGNSAFAPANFTVKEGQNVTLVFVNRGSAPHELQIPALGVSTRWIDAGATTRVSFIPNKVGMFAFDQPVSAGPVPQVQGINGHLTVLPP
jgi:plastocyanin